jgi:acyl carrier protein
MSDEDFLVEFIQALDAAPGSIALDTPLSSIETWDSVSYLAVMMFVDEKMGVALSPEALLEAQTPRAILERARQG